MSGLIVGAGELIVESFSNGAFVGLGVVGLGVVGRGVVGRGAVGLDVVGLDVVGLDDGLDVGGTLGFAEGKDVGLLDGDADTVGDELGHIKGVGRFERVGLSVGPFVGERLYVEDVRNQPKKEMRQES